MICGALPRLTAPVQKKPNAFRVFRQTVITN